jgi:hypothetical protein
MIPLEAGGAERALEGVGSPDVAGRSIDDHIAGDRADGLESGDQLILLLGGFLSLFEQMLQPGRFLGEQDTAGFHRVREFRPEIEGVLDGRDPLRDCLAKSHKMISSQPYQHPCAP